MKEEKQAPDIDIQITQNFKDIQINPEKIKQLVKAICLQFEIKRATISIAVVDDNEIQQLNKKFLRCDCTTDCLSFDLSDSSADFDLVVNGQKAASQAKSRNHSSQAELALYVTHCLLHNLGFDDQNTSDAEKMHAKEDEILQQAGYGLVYNSRNGGGRRQ